MIHSMSGGVLAENEIYTFIKVEKENPPLWYLSPCRVKAGDTAMVPAEGGAIPAKVVRVEHCSRQTAPVPVNRAIAAEKIIPAK